MTEAPAIPPLVRYAEAARSPDPLLRLEASALRAAVALVPAPLAAFVTVTRRLTVGSAVVLQAADGRVALDRAWERYVRTAQESDPFGRSRPAGSDAVVLTLGAGGAPACRDYLRSFGMEDALAVLLRSDGAEVARVVLLRAAPFRPADAVALRRLQPLLEEAVVAGSGPPADHAGAAVLAAGGLTRREAEVATLVGRGATNAQIARSLNVSEATVKTHLVHVYGKLGVQTRTQLAILVGLY